MNLEPFTGPGSTPSRLRLWDKITEAVIASQKVAGKNISVDEYQGYGSIISVNPQRISAPAGGFSCSTDPQPDPIILTISGVLTCPGFEPADFNGAFELPAIATGEWAAFIDFTDPFPFTVAYDVHCIGGGDIEVTLDSGILFFDATGAPPGPLTNPLTCDDSGVGEGGTATVTLP